MIHWNVTGLKNGRNIPQLTQSVRFILIYNFSLVFMDFNVDEICIFFSRNIPLGRDSSNINHTFLLNEI